MIVEGQDDDPDPGQTVAVQMGGSLVPCTVVASSAEVLFTEYDPAGTVIGTLKERSAGEIEAALALEGHPGAHLPYLGEPVVTTDGSARIVGLDVPRGLVTVEFDSGDVKTVPASELIP